MDPRPTRLERVPPRAPHLIASFGHAAEGILATARSEQNFRIHLFGALVVVATILFLPVTVPEALALLLCAGGVLAGELFNTAIEAVVDLSTDKFDLRAKRAKDAAAGGVLTLAILSVVVFGIVLGRVLWRS